MKWKGQTDKVASQISKFSGVISKLRKSLPTWILIQIYNAFIQPYLQYCLVILGSANLSQVAAAQNRLVRNLVGQRTLCHMDPIYSRLGILKVTDLYIHELHKVAFRTQNSLLPSQFSMILSPSLHINHSYNTRSKVKDDLVSVGQVAMKGTFSCAAKEWNCMSSDLKASRKFPCFNKSSKKSLCAAYHDFVCRLDSCHICNKVQLLQLTMPVTRTPQLPSFD